MTSRQDQFRALAESNSRHWFARAHDYVPSAFALLTDPEWDLMLEWFAATDSWPGELNIPGLSLLQGLIEGSGITRIVELGRYEGYTTLLVGFMLRRMGAHNALISFDCAPEVTERARQWRIRADLNPYIQMEFGDSRDRANVEKARAYLGGAPRLIFLDTSHAYDQTLDELDLWYPALAPGGFLLCHDSSEFAKRHDGTGQGGVKRGLEVWLGRNRVDYLNLNAGLTDWGQGVYADPNGMAILT